MQRMHNPEREAKKADRISRSKTFKPRITSTDYDSFTFKCRLCMMGFRRRGMLVSARLRTARPCSGDGSGTVFCTKPVTGFRPWPGTKRRRTVPSLGLLSPLVTPCCLCHGSFPVFLGRGPLITFHCSVCFALPLSGLLSSSCSLLCSRTYSLAGSLPCSPPTPVVPDMTQQ